MIPRLRVWDKKNEKMIYAGELYLFVFGCYKDDVWVHNADKNHNILTRDIMQSTGLKDKNGVEIYEGDIVTRTHKFNGAYGETFTGKVIYNLDFARYEIIEPNKYIGYKSEGLRNILSELSDYEIIGNIYENPELLEVAE